MCFPAQCANRNKSRGAPDASEHHRSSASRPDKTHLPRFWMCVRFPIPYTGAALRLVGTEKEIRVDSFPRAVAFRMHSGTLGERPNGIMSAMQNSLFFLALDVGLYVHNMCINVATDPTAV